MSHRCPPARLLLLLLLLALLALPAPALAATATQTDWSGGDGIGGPVVAFGDAFDSATAVDFSSSPGQITLTASLAGTTVDPLFPSVAGLRLGDVDGDGDLDLVGASYHAGGMAWWANDGAGGWTKAAIAPLPGAWSVDLADVNGDGDLDVLATSQSEGEIRWWRNDDGDGTAWSGFTVVDLPVQARSVRGADMDGDGDVDIVGVYGAGDDVHWWENTDGTGQLLVEHLASWDVDGLGGVHPTDMDGDGDIDLAVACAAGCGVHAFSWWENPDGSGDGLVQHGVATALPGASTVVDGDMDGDGDLDLIGLTDIGGGDTTVNWFENDGTGIGWTTQVIDAAFDGSYGDRSLAVADLDGDGDLDVVAGSSDTNRELAWWANDGAGGGWSKHVLEVGFGAHSVDVGDVDGDGTLEIAAGSWTGGTPYNGEIKLWDFDQYAASGQLVSSILDTIDPGSWGSAAWTAAVPTGAAVLLEVRGAPWFGDIEDATWSTVGSSGDPMLLPDDAVYIQYRVTLTSSDDASPALQEVALSWEFASSDDDDSATDDDDATPDDDDATPDDDDATPDDDDSAATDDDDSSADDDDSSAGDDDDSGGGGGAGCDGCQATGRGAATGFALLAVVAVGLRRRRLRP